MIAGPRDTPGPAGWAEPVRDAPIRGAGGSVGAALPSGGRGLLRDASAVVGGEILRPRQTTLATPLAERRVVGRRGPAGGAGEPRDRLPSRRGQRRVPRCRAGAPQVPEDRRSHGRGNLAGHAGGDSSVSSPGRSRWFDPLRIMRYAWPPRDAYGPTDKETPMTAETLCPAPDICWHCLHPITGPPNWRFIRRLEHLLTDTGAATYYDADAPAFYHDDGRRSCSRRSPSTTPRSGPMASAGGAREGPDANV